MLPFGKLNNSKYQYDLEIRYDPFYLELNPDQPSAKLPGFFTEEHGHEVAEQVLLIDPNGNMTQVFVEKLSGGAFFGKGWSDLNKLYQLPTGGWVKIVYAREDRFLIQVRDRLDKEVLYPTTPHIMEVGKNPVEINLYCLEFVPQSFFQIAQKPDVYHVLTKAVTYADVYSGRLQIPFDFCKAAFKDSGIRILLFDEFGIESPCYLQWKMDSPTTSFVADGWQRFCSLKRLTPGRRIQLGVPFTNPYVLQVKLLKD